MMAQDVESLPRRDGAAPGVVRRHLLLLLLVTLLLRGLLYLSYPVGGLTTEDNQAGQQYLIDELLRGNLLIGNLRYQTGYALVMAPVAALTQPLGRLSDRAFLLVQVALAALLPFLVYDTLRRRWSPRAGLVVALLLALDPFTLQWAHFIMPEWLVAWCVVVALWLLERAWGRPRRGRYALAAGLLLGVACLARLNMVPAVAALGLTLCAWWPLPWRERLRLVALVGGGSAGLLGLYLLLLHLPSTGGLRLSCISGNNLVVGLSEMPVPMTAAAGPATAYFLEIVNLPPLKPLSFYADSYPLWRKADGWVTPAEQAAFLAQPRPAPADAVTVTFPGNLYYYLGPCAADALLADIHREALAAHPGAWLAGVLRQTLVMLVQHPQLSSFPLLYLPRPEALTFTPAGLPGFATAQGGYYNGQIVFVPGITLFAALFDVWNLFKWLLPPAVLWALWRRDWYWSAVLLVLLVALLTIAIAARPEPRYYASVAPLYALLIGGMVADALERLRARWS